MFVVEIKMLFVAVGMKMWTAEVNGTSSVVCVSEFASFLTGMRTDHPLGVWLTKKAQQITSSVFVKVVADVQKKTQQEGIASHAYRCKAVLVFR
eukprot:420073-Hanusia_phi.AAC.1